MMKIMRKLVKKLGLAEFFIRFFIKINDFSLMEINKLTIIENDGIHPKHGIMKYHDFFINNVKRGSRVLDIGCGNGAVAFDVAKKANKIVAIDLDKKNLEIAERKYRAKNIDYVCADATEYDFKENFDYIILSNVLEHIEKRIEFLKKIKKLAPVILIRVPMINRDWVPLYKKKLGMYYYSDKTHFIEYDTEVFKKEMKSAGLKIKNYSIQFGEIWAVIDVIVAAIILTSIFKLKIGTESRKEFAVKE